MQDRPICFKCTTQVDNSPVYEAPCGHDRCSSVVFHGICLMEWREHREEFLRRLPEAVVIVFHAEKRSD